MPPSPSKRPADVAKERSPHSATVQLQSGIWDNECSTRNECKDAIEFDAYQVKKMNMVILDLWNDTSGNKKTGHAILMISPIHRKM